MRAHGKYRIFVYHAYEHRVFCVAQFFEQSLHAFAYLLYRHVGAVAQEYPERVRRNDEPVLARVCLALLGESVEPFGQSVVVWRIDDDFLSCNVP